MLKRLTAVLLVLGLSLGSWGSWKYWEYINVPTPLPSKRNPASIGDVFLGGAGPIGSGIATGASGIFNYTVETIKPLVIKNKLYGFLKDVPLTPEVRSRVYSRIESEKFMGEIVPFLFSLKDLYMSGNEASAKNFTSHIKKYFQANDLPGLAHSMFSFDPPAPVAGAVRRPLLWCSR